MSARRYLMRTLEAIVVMNSCTGGDILLICTNKGKQTQVCDSWALVETDAHLAAFLFVLPLATHHQYKAQAAWTK